MIDGKKTTKYPINLCPFHFNFVLIPPNFKGKKHIILAKIIISQFYFEHKTQLYPTTFLRQKRLTIYFRSKCLIVLNQFLLLVNL